MLLYLHIPFCDSKCFYCSFNSYTNIFHLQKKYSKAILEQLKYEINTHNIEKKSIETIFIGGGTPSSFHPKYYKDFFKFLSPYLKDNIEFTTEANPNSATLDWIKAMKDLGVNRISFGVQSFNIDKLKYLGRTHTSKEAIKAVENAYNIGIENISIDLIYDTKLDNKKLLSEDLNIASNLPINHLSSYSLTIEKGTKFYQNKISINNDEKLSFWFVKNIKKIYPQYEISNFGIYHSKHNLGYWQLKNYLGIGSGAVSFFDQKRYYPTKNVQNYIKNPTLQKIEYLSQKDLKIEKIFLGLRSKIGFKKQILSKNELKNLSLLINENKLIEKNNHIFNTNYFLADEIALFLIED